MNGDYTLAYGTHATPQDGRCAMEWVSHLAGEPHSDQPMCVSPVLRALCIALNDGLEHEARQRLRPYLVRTIGTVNDGLDPDRAWMALDWLIRDYAPRWLDLAALSQPTTELRSIAPVLESTSLQAALQRLGRARAEARGARALGPWSPIRSAAREAAWSCTGAAAWAAARLAVDDPAGDSARAAARAIAADAAAVAANIALRRRPPAEPGRAATIAAARAALAPGVAGQQAAIFGLLDRMLPTEPLPVLSAGATGDPVLATAAL